MVAADRNWGELGGGGGERACRRRRPFSTVGGEFDSSEVTIANFRPFGNGSTDYKRRPVSGQRREWGWPAWSVAQVVPAADTRRAVVANRPLLIGPVLTTINHVGRPWGRQLSYTATGHCHWQSCLWPEVCLHDVWWCFAVAYGGARHRSSLWLVTVLAFSDVSDIPDGKPPCAGMRHRHAYLYMSLTASPSPSSLSGSLGQEAATRCVGRIRVPC